jgi:antirestriction protein ArdC
VALHEVTHWTGAKHRFARDFASRFGTESYAFEEFIAELGIAEARVSIMQYMNWYNRSKPHSSLWQKTT